MVPIEKVETLERPTDTVSNNNSPATSRYHDNQGNNAGSVNYKGLEWMESEPGDPKQAPSRHECTKLVTRINKDLAVYCCLSMGLGSVGDSYSLREELKLLGVKLFDMVQLCKRRLMPLLMSKRMKEDESADLERLYRIFGGCLDMLQEEFIRVITLQSSFPLWDSNNMMIQTGISDSMPCKKLGSYQGSQELSQEERRNLEQEEFANLEKRVISLQEMSYTTSQLMDIKPWDVMPDTDHTKIEVETSDVEGQDEPIATITQVNTHANTHSPRHRKWIWIAVLVIGTIVVIGAVLALALTLNNDDG